LSGIAERSGAEVVTAMAEVSFVGAIWIESRALSDEPRY
jgi:hypothetical protein